LEFILGKLTMISQIHLWCVIIYCNWPC